MTTAAQLQRAIGAVPDGLWGPQSKAALLAHFTNPQANAITDADVGAAAARLGCSARQIRAVWQVEAGRHGFDRAGMPKMLYERHKFHRLTAGQWTPATFSLAQAGGYSIDDDHNGVGDSWDKLSAAIATGAIDAAFQSCSWGAFQIMGEWWDELDFVSPYALAWSCAQSEGDQLELFVRFVEYNRLTDELRALTSTPGTCAAFAAAYNGPGFRKFAYDEKLAHAMETLP